MTPDPLPPDLLALEYELAARPRPEPSAGLRGRVLAAARRERFRPARAGFPRFAAATAAAALVAINLSASVANDTDWRLRRPAAGDVAGAADRIRELAPDLPDREVARQALLLNTAAALVPAPAPAPPAGQLLRNKDPDRWDTR